MNENTFDFESPLSKIVDRFKLETVCCADEIENIMIKQMDVNRPGLPITGFFDYFDPHRIQVFGKVEYTYLSQLDDEKKIAALEGLFSRKIPALIISRGLDIIPEMVEIAEKYRVPVFRTSESTSRFMSALISYLNVELGQRITRHGVLVEVYGEGVLILGESGVGKSETAIELVKRGHRLVADDAVEIKKVSAISLVGTAPEIIRHFVELRGIGIIDVQKIFGMGAVKASEKIDLIINIEQWEKNKKYDRLGLNTEYTEILGIKVPSITIPVKPGRNLAVIVEVAAMNNRQKRMGYNAAEELNERITKSMENAMQQNKKGEN
ncbi:MAG: HPr(Ser) kinase/phosphatase [Clostridia bacterium]|nr:HPr(Ser) kinase/phosphatase [Clostridia bacterium]